MTEARRVFIDLSASPLLGTAAKSVWIIKGLLESGHEVCVINKDWGKDIPVSGMTYNSSSDSYDNPSWTQLWDPATHPTDFFENLVFSAFEGASFSHSVAKEGSLFSKFRRIARTLFDPRYVTNHDFVAMHMEKHVLRGYPKQKLKDLWSSKSAKAPLLAFYFCLHFFVFRRFKITAWSSGFRYKLAPHLYTEEVKNFISKAKEENKKYILLSVLWDETKKFEKREFLKGGPLYDSVEFQNLLNYVADLDKVALENGKIKFLLASKKAVDWETYLKSDYLDLRNFEKLGFCLSQSVYIAQELASATINWPSTYTIWITNCSGIEHLTWMDNRDTAPWSRNSLQMQPIGELLKRIDAL